MKIVKLKAYLPVIILIALLLNGCSMAENNTIRNPSPGPETIRLEPTKKSTDDINLSYYHVPMMESAFASNADSEIIGTMNDDSSTTYDSLYKIDMVKEEASKIADIGEGYTVFNADINADWIVWVEKNDTEWRIFQYDRPTKEKVQLDSGVYTKNTGPDFPSVNIYEDNLVYDLTLETDQNIKTEIILTDLKNHEKKAIEEIISRNEYYGAPKIYENYVVWHQGEWSNRMSADVFIYDLKNNAVRKLKIGDLNAITPAIWGNYIVLNTYLTDSPENKNIFVYNIENDILTEITKTKEVSIMEYYSPSLTHGLVTWNQNQGRSCYIYSIRDNQFHTITSAAEQISMLESWLCWRDPDDRKGLYLLPVVSLGALLDPQGQATIDNQIFNTNKDLLEQLQKMSPPEVLALWEESLRTMDFNMIDTIASDEEGIASKEEWMKELKKDDSKLISYKVSRDYVSFGDHAIAYLLETVYQSPGGLATKSSAPYGVNLFKQNGYWRIIQNSIN